MKAKLICKTGQLAGAEFEIKDEATIGTKTDNSIELYPSIISGRHARIYYDPDYKSYFLEDLNSRNGTQVDGMEVKQPEKLGNLHIITFANTFDFIFQVRGESLPAAKGKKDDTSKIAKTMIEDDFVVPPSIPETAQSPKKEDEQIKKTVADDQLATLPEFIEKAEAKEPDEENKTVIGDEPLIPPDLKRPEQTRFTLKIEKLNENFELKQGRQVVGRAEDCEITLDDPSISRQHTLIVLEKDKIFVEDMGSKNHTFIDDTKLTSRTEFQAGKKLRFGEVEAIVEKRT